MRLRVKFFGTAKPLRTSFFGKDGYSIDLENEVDQWLMKHPEIEVAEIKQSVTGYSFFGAILIVSVWYRYSKDEQTSP